MAEARSCDKPSSLADAVRRLGDRKSTSYVYNALVFIRTNYAKGSDAAAKLRHLGGIENLIKVLSELENIKCHDVALSILGNSCLDNKVRLQVLKCGGISILCDVLRNATKESIRNRACRVLTNLSENIACCDVIYDQHSDVISVIVAGLSETTDKGSMATYCRAIRMLSDTDEHRAVILGSGAVKPVAAMLSSEDDSVVLAAMKTLSHFVNHCSEECVRQLVAASVLSLLVPLTSSLTSEISTMSGSILLSVATSVPRLRPYLSGAEAMKFFIRQVMRWRVAPLESRSAYRAVDAICHCCRDANSRVKVRELGGLEVLTEILASDQFVLIHDRVISALVCFIYDDMGIEGLLQNGLITNLVPHLYRCASIPRHDDVVKLDWLKSSRVRIRIDSYQSSGDVRASSSASSNDVPAIEKPPSLTIPAACTEGVVDVASCDSGSKMSVDVPQLHGSLPINVVPDAEESSTSDGVLRDTSAVNMDETGVKEKDHLNYSIHSPTYKAVLKWQTNAVEDPTDDAAPRNIYESAFMFADSRSRSGSSSPSQSLASSSPYRRSSPAYSLHSSSSNPDFGSEGWASPTSPWSSPSGSSSPLKLTSVSPVREPFSPFSMLSYPSPSQTSSPSYTSANVDYELDFSSPTEASCGTSPVSADDCAEEEPNYSACVVDLGSACDSKNTEQSLEAIRSTSLNISDLPMQLPRLQQNTAESEQGRNTSYSCAFMLKKVSAKTTDSDIEGAKLSLKFETLCAAARNEDSSQNPSSSSFRNVSAGPDVDDAVEAFETPTFSKSNEKTDNDDDEFGESDAEDELDIEAYQRSRDNQRKYDRLLDIANGMYADVQLPSSKSSATSSAALFCKNKRRHSSPVPAAVGEVPPLDEPCQQPSKTRKLEERVVTPSSSRVITNDPPEDSISAVSEPTRNKIYYGSEAARHHTEKNILNLISRVSHLPDPSAYLVEMKLLCGLLDYFVLARNPLPTCPRILLRLSRDPNCFESAVLSLFPLVVFRRLDSSWRPSDVSAEETNAMKTAGNPDVLSIHNDHPKTTEMASCEISNSTNEIKSFECKKEEPVKEEIAISSIKIKEEPLETESFEFEAKDMKLPIFKIKTEPMETDLFEIKKEEIESETNPEPTSNRPEIDAGKTAPRKKLSTPSELRDEILANLSVMAASAFGMGVLSHILLRGDSSQRELCAISLCYLCRNVTLRKKFLAEMKAVDSLINLLNNTSGRLFPGTVLALCQLVRQLPAPQLFDVDSGVEERSALQNDMVLILDDGSSVEACRQILVDSSRVFAAMLSGSFREAAESRVKLPEVSSVAIGLLIDLTHGRRVVFGSEPPRDILDAILECFELSHRFQLPNTFNHSLYRRLVLGIASDVEYFSGAFGVLNACGFQDHCRDLVVRLFSEEMDLARRCSAVSDLVSGAGCVEFLSTLRIILLESFGM